LVTAANDSTVTVWDLATKKKRALQPPKATAFAFSPNGKKLALFGPGVILWELSTGNKEVLINLLTTAEPAFGFSVDGRILAWTNGSGPPTLWDLDPSPGKERATAGLPQALNLVFSPNNQTIALGGDGFPIRIWDVGKPKQIGVTLGKASTLPVCFSADGRK